MQLPYILCTFVWYWRCLVFNYGLCLTVYHFFFVFRQLVLVFQQFVFFQWLYVILKFTVSFQELLKLYLWNYQNRVPLLLCWLLAMLSYLTWMSSVGWGLQMISFLHQIFPAHGVWVRFKAVSWQHCRLISENIWLGSQVGLGVYWLIFYIYIYIACSWSWSSIWNVVGYHMNMKLN